MKAIKLVRKLISIILLVGLSVPAFCANPSFQSFSQTWFTSNSLTIGLQPNIPVTKLTIGDASLDFAQAPFQIRSTFPLGEAIKIWGAGGTSTLNIYTNIFQYTNVTAETGLTLDSSGNFTGSGVVTAGHGLVDGTGTQGKFVAYGPNGVLISTNAPAGGSGTVTSVTFTGDGTVLSSTPSSAVTTSGTLAATLISQAANTGLYGPTSGGNATPTFRAQVAADVPNLDAGKITTGTFASARLPLASSVAFGAVEVDNTTIAATAGVISVIGATNSALLYGFFATNTVNGGQATNVLINGALYPQALSQTIDIYSTNNVYLTFTNWLVHQVITVNVYQGAGLANTVLLNTNLALAYQAVRPVVSGQFVALPLTATNSFLTTQVEIMPYGYNNATNVAVLRGQTAYP